MAIDYLNKNGLSYFWSKLKAYFAPKAHTHNAFETKHSYTTAANAAKNWYRIANASTQQLDTSKPIHAQFILTAYNASYDAGYYERWFVNAEVFGRNACIVILGNTSAPFSQARILYENTIADIDANDRPAIDICLNYVLPNGTTKIEIEEVYNNGGWTFVADGQLAASTIPSGFESVASTIRNNGIDRSTTADYASYLNRQISNITAAFTLADSYLYRSRTLNCTGTFTITVPSINSGYMWCVIKNKNTSFGVITLHPSTTSVLIDGSNADITLQPMEYVCLHSAGANNYSLIADGRWKSQKADKATTLAGYGITDAKIANGTITLGSNSITPLTSVPSHNQASNTINAMTGYSKPSSTSAIATGDTLNQAIGKLEKAIDDADISNTVHLTGNEFVGGIKEFGNSYYDSTREGETDWESSSLIIRYQNYIKGSGAPSANKHANLLFLDKIGNNINWSGRLGAVESAVNSSGAYGISIACYKNEIIDNFDTHDRSMLSVGYDADGIKYAVCPSTSSDRNSSTDILTRDWIPKDTRIVHTTGDETVGGKKTFTDDLFATKYIYIQDSDVQAGTSVASNKYRDLSFVIRNAADDGWERVGVIEAAWYPNGSSRLVLSTYHYVDPSKPIAQIVAGHDAAGNPYTQAVTPPSGSNGADIATTAWTNSKYVDLTSAQTIGGTKTFSNDITVKRANPYMHCFETDVTCGVGVVSGVTSYAGYGFGDKNNVTMGEIIGRYYGAIGNKHYFIFIRALNCTGSSPTSTTPVGMMCWDTGVLSFMPEATNTVLLGGSSRRWKEVWCNQSSINSSSDERLKEDIGSIPDEVLDAWEDVSWIQYRFKDANREKHGNARLHAGAIAQRVDEAFSSHGLDASRYGFFLHDEWGETPEAKDANGNILQTYQAAGDEYGLRYVEALCMEAAYMRRRADRAEARIAALEDRLAALELRLGSE